MPPAGFETAFPAIERRPVPPTTYKVQKKSMYTRKTNNCTNLRPLLMKIQVVGCWN